MEKVEEATLPNRPIDDESKKSPQTISILVVDHDTTCLAIVAAILKKFKYEVVTVKHANDALCMLRIKGGEFDLVVSDVHMPDMNGFELQRAIAQEFDNLPVVLMSADEEEGVALRGLENGAVFFICKPVCPDDVQDLWQFASTKRRQSNVKIHEEKNKTCNETTIVSVASSAVPREGLKKKPISQEISDNAKKGESSRPTGASSSSQKKAKIVWTNSLHNRFLEAIRSIGLDRAVPKKILEVMNVPGLTRENVASHLQKYRIFLRRVSDASYNVQYPTEQKRIGISSSGRSLFMSSSSSSSTQPTFPLLNRFPYRKFGGQYFPYSSSPGSLMINQPGIFRQPKLSIPFTPQQPPQPLINPLTGPTTLMNPTAVAPTNPSYFNDITTPSNYVGYSLSDLQHLAGNNAPAPVEPLNVDDYMDESTFDSSFGDLSSVIGDYAQLLSSNPPNVGNNFPMLDLHQGDLFDILNQPQPQPQPQPQSQPQPQPQVGNFTTAGNFFDNMSPWDQNSAPSFDPAPTNNQQFCNQDLVNPQEFTATSTGQLNNTRQSMQIPPIPNEQVSQGLTNNDFQGFNNPSSQLRDKTQLATTVVEPDLDEFLESLLIPFGDIQSLEGI